MPVQSEKKDLKTGKSVLAFENAEYTDGNEQNLVAALRKSKSFIMLQRLQRYRKLSIYTLFFHFSKRFMRITVFHSRGIYF